MKAESVRLPKARQDELFVEQMDEELLVYDARHFRAHRLNPTAAWMWRHCDGQRTVAEATQLLSDELRQPVDEELVWLSLESLDKAHLLSTPLRRPSGATDDSRRAMFQKLAVAGGLMLLLPAITPLTRPAEADEVGTPTAVKIPKGTAVAGTVTESGEGVKGRAERNGTGVEGSSEKGRGVSGYSNGEGDGVRGHSLLGHGVVGTAYESGGGSSHFGVKGECPGAGGGVQGISKRGNGVYGATGDLGIAPGGAGNNSGVKGEHPGTGAGVTGASQRGYGVAAYSASGTAFYAESQSGGRAGMFKGDVEVTGDIRLLNADCAEDFDIADDASIEPGTVMVLGDEGALEPSASAYDKRAAGVISGAGDFKPGLILDKRPTGRLRQPVALMGKVFCKADASYGAIEAGDLLTTSDTPGHAMKAGDPARTSGAVVGKALRALPEGQGLIPILVSLQ